MYPVPHVCSSISVEKPTDAELLEAMQNFVASKTCYWKTPSMEMKVEVESFQVAAKVWMLIIFCPVLSRQCLTQQYYYFRVSSLPNNTYRVNPPKNDTFIK